MSEPLTDAEVTRIARLARLALTPDERSLYAAQLGRILEYAEQIRSLDTRDVPPTSALLDDPVTERTDDPRPSLTPEAATANAPRALGGLFAVPRVIGGA